jgi:hypothetical protein
LFSFRYVRPWVAVPLVDTVVTQAVVQ